MKISEELNEFIRENGGNERDALNVALAKLQRAEERIEYLEQVIERQNDEYFELLHNMQNHE